MSPWNKEDILEAFRGLVSQHQGKRRAIHKPLLVLMALSELHHHHSRWLYFNAIEEPLKELLDTFGPTRKRQHVQAPFWRLQKDRIEVGAERFPIWEVLEAEELERELTKSGDPSLPAMRAMNARGGYSQPLYEALMAHPEWIAMLADDILDHRFPTSQHAELRAALALPTFVLPDHVKAFLGFLARHRVASEEDATRLLGGQRQVRRFSMHLDRYMKNAPFTVRIESVLGVKRYIREDRE